MDFSTIVGVFGVAEFRSFWSFGVAEFSEFSELRSFGVLTPFSRLHCVVLRSLLVVSVRRVLLLSFCGRRGSAALRCVPPFIRSTSERGK